MSIIGRTKDLMKTICLQEGEVIELMNLGPDPDPWTYLIVKIDIDKDKASLLSIGGDNQELLQIQEESLSQLLFAFDRQMRGTEIGTMRWVRVSS